jgi:hypothetical protein
MTLRTHNRAMCDGLIFPTSRWTTARWLPDRPKENANVAHEKGL